MKEECTNHVNETLSMHGWNEHNIDQFIFNSCIGGACVFEYYNDDIHMIRVSAKYAEVIGSAGMTSEAALALRWSDYLDEENLKIMQDAVRLSIATKDEVTSEYFLGKSFFSWDCHHIVYWLVTPPLTGWKSNAVRLLPTAKNSRTI